MTSIPQSSTDNSDTLWHSLVIAASYDDGAAAQEHLEAGFPVYYIEDDTPEGLLIKEYPDGHRELVRFNETGDEVIKIL
ncbi:hypothetical protein ZMO1_ZMOp33x001 (plasmid) [Zymomonas mobilis subsp. mobilis ZM4 = ATCC 31821]|uniref:hypothetical protein n=1 Tax=Zymomonas mobilis TaxID=542 RepID=UPI00078188D7|nr:hypothetical protein [Zymomonas mobilis]AVZ26819.1 hypothetical protein ZMO2_ZMOp33x001 [Zymomonas mobilis subsp. mobilis]AVZ28705.1 hypothetical protein ZMO3_ZMOp33x001 [Zymomonas mobilis subsp. mobilis]AVZ43151.1 hypothetical protein ZMO1_ZMOp33x001 [Zymomonas mobilis subsp. mobilis ZM4 = ATCC 31821]UBQ08738.1 hypothetical protein LB319_09665 [Zymomonas mobilis]